MLLLRVLLLTVACPVLSVAAVTRDASAQASDTFTLTLAGPTTTRPGEDIVYVLRHSYSTTMAPRQAPYFFDIPEETTYVSVSDTSGTDFAEALIGTESITPSVPDFSSRVVGQSNVQLTFIPSANDGKVTIRVKTSSDASGSIQAHARFGATGLGVSNEVVTKLDPVGFPSTGERDVPVAHPSTSVDVFALLVVGLTCGALGFYLDSHRLLRPQRRE